MSKRSQFGILAIIVILAGAGMSYRHVLAKTWRSSGTSSATAEAAATPPMPKARIELCSSQPGCLRVPTEVVRSLGINTVAVQEAPPPEPLKLDGSLYIDAESMAHVHSRFPGELVELGQFPEKNDRGEVTLRSIRFGDVVKKGDLLAVVWSKDLGEKKSELVEILTRLRLDEQQLKQLEILDQKGSIPERTVKEAKRTVDLDYVSKTRIEQTLRSWRVSEDEIAAIRKQAEEVHSKKGEWKPDLSHSWARVEVRAPLDGTIVEKNVVVGDFVDNTSDIFKIANLSRLDVMAYAYEEDLPELQTLDADQKRWTVFLRTDPRAPPLKGSFKSIGNIIDPNQHTALVMGWVDNSKGTLRIGQFVTAQIDLPASKDEVAIPASALIDQDGKNLVFVEIDSPENRNAAVREYECRTVTPVHRRDDLVFLAKESPGKAHSDKRHGLLPGEKVITAGGIELAAELMGLESSNVKTAAK